MMIPLVTQSETQWSEESPDESCGAKPAGEYPQGDSSGCAL